jgi:hypothetical protein
VGSFAAKSSANTRCGCLALIRFHRALLQIFIKTTPHHRLRAFVAFCFLRGFVRLGCGSAVLWAHALRVWIHPMVIHQKYEPPHNIAMLNWVKKALERKKSP